MLDEPGKRRALADQRVDPLGRVALEVVTAGAVLAQVGPQRLAELGQLGRIEQAFEDDVTAFVDRLEVGHAGFLRDRPARSEWCIAAQVTGSGCRRRW